MKVSILVPVYGVELYIERCAVSIFEQTYKDLDIIFVDDCSLDNSIHILEQVMKCYPSRIGQIKIVKHETKTTSRAFRVAHVFDGLGRC